MKRLNSNLRALFVPLLFAFGTSVVSECDGAFVIEFGELGVVGDNTYEGKIGDIVMAEIYLTQTDGEMRLNAASTGLAVADFQVSIDGANVSPVSTAFGPGFIDDLSGNTGTTTSLAQIASLESGALATSGVTTSNDGVANDSILIGTVSFQISSGAVGVYNLSAFQTPSFGSFSLADPAFPTPISAASATGSIAVSAVAVPEPSSVALFALTGAFVALARHRKPSPVSIDSIR